MNILTSIVSMVKNDQSCYCKYTFSEQRIIQSFTVKVIEYALTKILAKFIDRIRIFIKVKLPTSTNAHCTTFSTSGCIEIQSRCVFLCTIQKLPIHHTVLEMLRALNSLMNAFVFFIFFNKRFNLETYKLILLIG